MKGEGRFVRFAAAFAIGSAHSLFRRASQCSAIVEYDIWFARMVVMFFDGVHRVVGSRAALVDPSDGAVTNSATIVPGYRGASGNRLERWCVLASHNGLLLFGKVSPGESPRVRRRVGYSSSPAGSDALWSS